MATAMSLAALLPMAAAAQVAAPDRPYVFLVTPPTAASAPLASLELGYSGESFQPIGGNGLGQAVTLQSRLAGPLSLFARAGVASDEGTTRSSLEAELQWTTPSFLGSSTYLTLGGGAVREFDAVNAVRGRVSAGRAFSRSRVDGSIAFEHPMASGRDALDLVTSLGWMRAVSAHAQLGVEAVGQDLEGFWDGAEAEGGARLYLGPSGSLSAGSWRFGVTAGPVVRASRSDLTSAAPRPLPTTAARWSLGLRTAISRAF